MGHDHAVLIGLSARFREIVREALQSRDFDLSWVEDEARAREAIRSVCPGLLVVEVSKRGSSPGDLVEESVRTDPDCCAVVVGIGPGEPGAPPARLDVDLVPDGAGEPGLLYALERAAARRAARSRSGVRRRGQLSESRIVGHSPAAENLRRRVEALAHLEGSVLFSGEAGTGKQLAARAVHEQSARRAGPFRVLYCSALEEPALRRELLEGPGALEASMGGVLYLDEVGALRPAIQDGLVQRIHEVVAERGARVLCGSTMDLHRATEEGRFREDLLRRVAGSTVRIEPLRARLEDVPVLAGYFARRIAEINELPEIDLLPETLEVLGAYRWPGNVRELQNAVEHAAILALDGRVRPRDLPERVRRVAEEQIGPEGASSGRAFRDAKRRVVEAFERRYLDELMKRNRGNVTAASEQAGMLRSALQRLLRKHDMPSSKFRRSGE